MIYLVPKVWALAVGKSINLAQSKKIVWVSNVKDGAEELSWMNQRWHFHEKICCWGKVHIFWEGHKILRNLHLTFVLCSASPKLGRDFANFCGLLRIYELYRQIWLMFELLQVIPCEINVYFCAIKWAVIVQKLSIEIVQLMNWRKNSCKFV